MRYIFTLALLASVLFLFSCTPDSNSTETTDYVYSDSVFYGENLLIKDELSYSGVDFGLLAFVPTNGDLVVKITKKSGGNWRVVNTSINNWAISNFDAATNSQVFSSIEPDHWCHLHLEIPHGTFQLDYFEEDDVDPTYSKEIEIN